MKKFWAFCRAIWQMTLTYRAETFVWFVIETLPMIPMISLWMYLERSGRITSTQSSQIIVYFVLSLIISRLFSTHFEEWLIEDIKDGKISKNLLKPFSIRSYLLANELTWRTAGVIYLVPTIAIVLPLVVNKTDVTITLPSLALGFFILLVSFFQRFFLSWIISLAAFWIDQSKSLLHLRWMCEGILGGAWLPLSFFPLWWQNAAKVTPFYFWFYFPIQTITNSISHIELSIGIAISLIWLLVLAISGQVLWRKALEHYGAVGG